MHKIIGCEGMDCALLDDMRDTVWVDELGLARGKPIYAFKLPIMRNPFAGKAIVIGEDDTGRTCEPFFPLDMLRQEVKWLGRIVPEVTWIEEGKRCCAIVTYKRADL